MCIGYTIQWPTDGFELWYTQSTGPIRSNQSVMWEYLAIVWEVVQLQAGGFQGQN